MSLAVLMFLPHPAGAMLQKDEYTDDEKAGFAFYKLTKTQPDLRDWVAFSDRYQKLSQGARASFGQDELYRLQRGLSLYAPDEDLIKVAAIATIRTVDESKNPDPAKTTKSYTIDLGDADPVHFPFRVGRNWIAIIPLNIEQFQKVEIDPESAGKLQLYALRSARAGEIYVEMSLRPVSADGSKPMALNGKDMWLVMAAVDNIEIWDARRQVFLWSYSVPWYTSGHYNDLLNLYNK